MKWIGWIMKHLCCNKIIVLLFLTLSLYGSSVQKSAMMYFGKDISYPMVGVYDYIFVKPENINIYRHGFSLYNQKIYATLSTDDGYQQRVGELLTKGYKNFYFSVTKNEASFKKYLKSFRQKHPESKIALTAPKSLLKKVYPLVDAIVYYNALSTHPKFQKYLGYGTDIIDIEEVDKEEIASYKSLVKEIEAQHMVPYVTNYSKNIYGLSSKEVIKREIFTIIDEDKVDRIISSAHQYGAMPLEYMGYIQHIHNVSHPLPDVDTFATRYAGVVVWLSTDTSNFRELFSWLLAVKKKGIKIAFASNFGFIADGMLLSQFGIETSDGDPQLSNKKKIKYRDPMVGFEVEPQINDSTLYLRPKNPVKEILTYEDEQHDTSTPAAIMPWGGYAVFGSFLFELDDNNLWVINPFAFFKEALRLKDLPIPDVTTQNGKRLLFTHIDGDGIMNVYESDPQKVSGDMIYSKILKVYKIPHSVSVIGAEISPNGLYPELSKRLMNIAREMYALDNVEPATHTYTHTFKWAKITKDGDLDPKYRLDPPGYKYSLYNELEAPLLFIKKNLLAKDSKKHPQTVFWSGDCSPRVNALSFIYKHKLLNINGGYTTINNTEPWVTLVSPLGIERGGYYQVYTGAENENVYTNDWLGPFWGFKKVIQTYKRTNEPRRLKPIDVYYHLYSGSKLASINALKYIFDWVIQQDVMPIYTSEYIPKVMDFYEVSLAKEGDTYYISGMRDLKTLRFDTDVAIDFKNSPTLLGKRRVHTRTYVHLDQNTDHTIVLAPYQKESVYVVSANAQVRKVKQGKKDVRYFFKSHVDLSLELHIKKGCHVKVTPTPFHTKYHGQNVSMVFKNHKEANIDVICK